MLAPGNIFATPPEAMIEQLGPHSYRVYISHGIMEYGLNGYGWIVLGFNAEHARKRAVAKAQRELANYIAKRNIVPERVA